MNLKSELNVKIISVILILILILIPLLVFYSALKPRTIKNIELTYEKNTEDFDYVTKLLSNSKGFKYIQVYYDFNEGFFVTYILNNEDITKEESADKFFSKVLLGNSERIYKFYIRSNLDFISYSATENTVTYQMWSNRKLGRGIVYSEKKLEQE